MCSDIVRALFNYKVISVSPDGLVRPRQIEAQDYMVCVFVSSGTINGLSGVLSLTHQSHGMIDDCQY